MIFYDSDKVKELRTASSLPANPRISIVMPARNEEKYIQQTLEKIVKQEYIYGEFEIIVVDGYSDDDTEEIVLNMSKKYPCIKLFKNLKKLAGPARNIGVLKSTGDIIAIIDAHCHIPSNNLLNRITEIFKDSNAYCLCRPQPIFSENVSSSNKSMSIVRSSWLGHSPDSIIYETEKRGYCNPTSTGAIFRREIFDIVGYFEEDIDGCEDLDFNIRILKEKLASFFCHSLAINYFPRKTLKDFLKHMIRYGKGRIKVVKRHPTIRMNIISLIPLIFIFIFLAGIPLCLISSSIGLIYSIIIFVYLSIILIESLRLAVKNGWKYFIYMPFQLMAIHFGWGVGQLLSLTTSVIKNMNNFKSNIFKPSKY
jgi:glycosyltransferase involved in cell wall biosynthesis